MKFASLLIAGALLAPAFQQTPQLREAIATLASGDFRSAERKLRAEIAAHPDEPLALSLLGAALDNQGKSREADSYHRRAAVLDPGSPDILNNLAAHLMLAGDEPEAAAAYRRVIAIDPRQFNANVQLARLAIKAKDGHAALQALDRLSGSGDSPPILLLRLEALYLANRDNEADTLADRLTRMSAADANLGIAAGMALSDARRFEKAISFFEVALRSDPANFNLLYYLGIASEQTGQYGRAREALEGALRQQPHNPDVLYTLALAEEALGQSERAVQHLVQAVRTAPRRSDVQKLLAIATDKLGALDDAAAAWNRYLELQPNDDAARRERGYVEVRMGQSETGLAELEWFATRHAGDPMVHYELGQACRASDPDRAAAEFDKALALDAKFLPALGARGSLRYQQGAPEQALRDLETAATLAPDDAASLDRLGQVYQALDRPTDAVRVLHRASELAPGESKTLLHYARALADAGEIGKSKSVMDRFRELGPEKRTGVPAGFVEYLSMTPQQRRADYRARLAKAVREHPGDAEVQVHHLKLLLEDGSFDEAQRVATQVASLKPSPPVLIDAGRALLSAGKFDAAVELLAEAGPAAQTDLAIARAQVLRLAGRTEEAMSAVREAFDTALRAAPERADLYREATAFLVQNGQTASALELLDRAARVLPQDREILLRRAAALELAGRTQESLDGIVAIEARWPEWYEGWLAEALILSVHGRVNEAARALKTAVAINPLAEGIAAGQATVLTIFNQPWQ